MEVIYDSDQAFDMALDVQAFALVLCCSKLLHNSIISSSSLTTLRNVLLLGSLWLSQLREVKHISIVVLRQLSQERRNVVHVFEIVRDLLILLYLL